MKYEKEMSFLNPNIFRNEKRTEKNEQTESLLIKRIAVENSTGQIEPKEAKRPADTKRDAIQVFFDSIAETVRGFPKKTQVQLKRDIFNLVNNTEASLLNNEDESRCSLTFNEPLGEISPVPMTMQLDCGSAETSEYDNPESSTDIKPEILEFDENAIKKENLG